MGVRRILIAFCLLLLSILPGRSSADPVAIILIQHDSAGPNLPTSDFIHGRWILWPASPRRGVESLLLSLLTGLDWHGDPNDSNFRFRDGSWVAESLTGLTGRGHFLARSEVMGRLRTTLVMNPKRRISPSTLLLACEGNETVHSQEFAEPLPSHGLVIYEAVEWDDAVAIANRVAGRSITIEYPPPANQLWSRFWLSKLGWPAGSPLQDDLRVPGLISASRVGPLLLDPLNFEWQTDHSGTWGGANRWLEHGHGISPIVLITAFGALLLVSAYGFFLTANELNTPIASGLTDVAMLIPASLNLAGALSYSFGLADWPVWLCFAIAITFAIHTVLRLNLDRFAPSVHPLCVTCGVGLVVLATVDPVWSAMSPVFGESRFQVSPLALGAFTAYLVGFLAFAPSWLRRLALGITLIVGILRDPWWQLNEPSRLAIVTSAWVISEGWFQPVLLAVLALLPSSLLHLVRGGFRWTPNGLLNSIDQRQGIDGYQIVMFLISPYFLGSAFTAALFFMVGSRFTAYRLRRQWRIDARLRSLGWMSLSLLALAPLNPICFEASLTCAIGFALALLHESLRTA